MWKKIEEGFQSQQSLAPTTTLKQAGSLEHPSSPWNLCPWELRESDCHRSLARHGSASPKVVPRSLWGCVHSRGMLLLSVSTRRWWGFPPRFWKTYSIPETLAQRMVMYWVAIRHLSTLYVSGGCSQPFCNQNSEMSQVTEQANIAS